MIDWETREGVEASVKRSTDNPNIIEVSTFASSTRLARYTSLDNAHLYADSNHWLENIKLAARYVGSALLLADGIRRIRKGNMLVGIGEAALGLDDLSRTYKDDEWVDAYRNAITDGLKKLEAGRERVSSIHRAAP